jgi:hypothetical protein
VLRVLPGNEGRNPHRRLFLHRRDRMREGILGRCDRGMRETFEDQRLEEYPVASAGLPRVSWPGEGDGDTLDFLATTLTTWVIRSGQSAVLTSGFPCM